MDRARIGTAGWSVTREASALFPGDGSHLQRFSRVMGCAEINSSFYRNHQVEVYQRWAAEAPADFRFWVKLPQTITHDARLRSVRQPLLEFLSSVAGLGEQLAVLLVQLPPSLAFEQRTVRAFFGLLEELFDCAVVCEPRHASWFTPEAEQVLAALRVSRAAADPARFPEAARPGGWLGPAGDGCGAVLYYRWHGSPRMYWSSYPTEWLQDRKRELAAWPEGAQRWCIFDNTTSGAALANALELQAMLDQKAAG